MKLKTLFLAGALFALGAVRAEAGIYYDLQQSASSATLRMAGVFKMFSDTVNGTLKITLDGLTGTGTFAGSGNTTYSVVTSSGVNVQAGGVYAAFMSASSAFYGSLIGNVTGNLTGNVVGNLTGNVTGNVSGNAGTATALAANGANCSSGSFPLGVDASGASESCTDGATQSELDTHAALTGTSAHGAASANTASALVSRDGSGNFSAGTISAALNGNAGTATALAANGANCSAGSYPLGVDASGAVEGCTATGTPKYVLHTSSYTTAFFTGTGTIPYDNTKPQITEGFKVVTATHTASGASNILAFSVSICATETGNSGDNVASCVYKDGGADPIGCGAFPSGADLTPCRTMKYEFDYVVGDTSSHYYTVKIGCNVGTMDINGAGGAAIYGGGLVSGVKIDEIVP